MNISVCEDKLRFILAVRSDPACTCYVRQSMENNVLTYMGSEECEHCPSSLKDIVINYFFFFNVFHLPAFFCDQVFTPTPFYPLFLRSFCSSWARAEGMTV